MNISDLSFTIVPKSDQLNAEQLLGGPMDLTVTDVRVGSTDEQPISVHYAGDNGRPYKPCKTMRKVLIFAWGPDGREWIGRSMRVYNDPHVRFGGAEVGGIRISHLSDISGPIKVSLTATKGKKAPYTIAPMERAQTGPVLADVLQIVAQVKGQKSKQHAESLIEQLPPDDRITAAQALDARIAALQAASGAAA